MALIVPKLRADEVLRALSRVYNNDKVIFLAETKTGPTWYSDGLQRMDALTIKKSWTKPCITGYEIKVSRADFMGDEKWPGYLDYCHRFYFACPSGLIKPEELSPEVGLVWVNEAGGARVRKKALFRNIEPPASLFYHLVISHMEPSYHPFFSSTREMLLAYLEDKKVRYALGRRVRQEVTRKMRKLDDAREEIQDTATRYEEMRQENKALTNKIREQGYRGMGLDTLVDKLLEDAVKGQALGKLTDIKPSLEALVKALAEGDST